MSKHDIGLVGLAVMGQNLVLNMANHGYSVGVFNRTTSTTDEFVSQKTDEQQITGYHTLQELVDNLATPRKVMLMVKAGPAVDAIIDDLKGMLSPGDIIIDGEHTL
jgi:6-phosphogluconate dehydrogenase